MIYIQATFTGQPTLGYENGQSYMLRVQEKRSWIMLPEILIERLDGSGMCPYKNIETFLANWKCVTAQREGIFL